MHESIRKTFKIVFHTISIRFFNQISRHQKNHVFVYQKKYFKIDCNIHDNTLFEISK